MGKSNKILFIGNFLSKTRGSLGVTEKLTKHLKGGDFEIVMASHFENQLLRLLHFIWFLLFKSYQIVHVDIYSGNAFKIVQVSLFFAKKIRNKRVIGTLHGGGLAEFDKKKSNLVKNTLSNFDELLSPSNYLIKYFIDLDIKYLPNGAYYFGPPKDVAPVLIESGAWIGGHSIILSGSHINKTVLLGANSLFKGNSVENGIYAGNPAKLIRIAGNRK